MKPKRGRIVLVVVMLIVMSGICRAAESAPAVLQSIPVREVTVFKDGHAFVLHEGRMPTNPEGNVGVDYLPRPIVGTFWPYCADSAAKLDAVTAGKRHVNIERTALDLRSLIATNPGKNVVVTENGPKDTTIRYDAKIVGIPTRTSAELMATSPPGTADATAQKGDVVMLRVGADTKVIPIGNIRDITFAGDPVAKVADDEIRNFMMLKLAWNGTPRTEAEVGLVYLQHGMRWIPNYRVTIDGAGKAHVELEATLVNDLTDLDDVTVNLVVGVPTFKFSDTLDPISLQEVRETAARVAQRAPYQSQMHFLSNAATTQMAAPMRDAEPAAAPVTTDLGPSIGAGRNEDLYLFTLLHVTLKRGERLVKPVASFDLTYEDIYTVEIPFAPSFEMFQDGFDSGQARELARLQAQPRAMHKIRLANGGQAPLTTAPALILSRKNVLAQSMMTYTAPGAKVDLSITNAMDVVVMLSDRETARKFHALSINDSQYMRINSQGKIILTNRRAEPVRIEVTRYVLGTIDQTDNDGKVLSSSLIDYQAFLEDGGLSNWLNRMPWWVWNSHINSIDRGRWELTLDHGESKTLGYEWHYFWR